VQLSGLVDGSGLTLLASHGYSTMPYYYLRSQALGKAFAYFITNLRGNFELNYGLWAGQWTSAYHCSLLAE